MLSADTKTFPREQLYRVFCFVLLKLPVKWWLLLKIMCDFRLPWIAGLGIFCVLAL